MKVALVHDWLIHVRGGEKVLESLAEIFPEATIYTLFSDRKKLSPGLRRMKIKNSALQFFPGIRSYYPWLLPFLPFFIRTLRVEGVELVISSSHCVAKAARIPAGAKHICYCHTPMRYLWGFEEEYFGRYPKPLIHIIEFVLKKLRAWDVRTAKNVDFFICNSQNVQKKIQILYDQSAEVVYPPVDLEMFYSINSQPRSKKETYLIVSALTPYKRIDLAIQAFTDWQRSLCIVGDGPLRARLEGMVRTPNIRFMGKVSDERLRELYNEAKALVFPQEEDFGIVPLEAQACGTPVIAYGRGGALETVKNGVFFYEQTPAALRQAVLHFESQDFDSQALQKHVLQFEKKEFKLKIRQTIEKCLHPKNEPSRRV